MVVVVVGGGGPLPLPLPRAVRACLFAAIGPKCSLSFTWYTGTTMLDNNERIGTRKTKRSQYFLLLRWWLPLFVLSQCFSCCPAWSFSTTWITLCKGPIVSFAWVSHVNGVVEFYPGQKFLILLFHSSYYSLSGSFLMFFIVVQKVIKSLNNRYCLNWNAMF